MTAGEFAVQLEKLVGDSQDELALEEMATQLQNTWTQCAKL